MEKKTKVEFSDDAGAEVDVYQQLDEILEEANKQYDENGNVVDADPDPPAEPETETKAEATPEPKYSKQLIRELRLRDRKGKSKTCSKCAVRRPINEMDDGKADVCVHCG